MKTEKEIREDIGLLLKPFQFLYKIKMRYEGIKNTLLEVLILLNELPDENEFKKRGKTIIKRELDMIQPKRKNASENSLTKWAKDRAEVVYLDFKRI